MPEYKRWANSASFLELQILLKIPPQMTAVGKKIIPFSKSYLKLFSIGIGVMYKGANPYQKVVGQNGVGKGISALLPRMYFSKVIFTLIFGAG